MLSKNGSKPGILSRITFVIRRTLNRIHSNSISKWNRDNIQECAELIAKDLSDEFDIEMVDNDNNDADKSLTSPSTSSAIAAASELVLTEDEDEYPDECVDPNDSIHDYQSRRDKIIQTVRNSLIEYGEGYNNEIDDEIIHMAYILNNDGSEYQEPPAQYNQCILTYNRNFIPPNGHSTNGISNSYSPLLHNKLRYMYNIILRNLHNEIAKTIKRYDDESEFKNKKSMHGIFGTSSLLLRIDTASEVIKSELDMMQLFGGGINQRYRIILPYVIHTPMRKRTVAAPCAASANPNIDASNSIIISTTNTANTTSTNTTNTAVDDTTNSTISFLSRRRVFFSIQPYLPNSKTLHAWLRDKMVIRSNVTILSLFQQLAESLSHLHAVDIIHGDIKSMNILICKNNEASTRRKHPWTPYLIDFGLAGRDGHVDGTGGTAPYCHPETKNTNEQVSMSGYVWGKGCKRNDVWSLGFLFLTILLYGQCKSYYHNYDEPGFFTSDKYVCNHIIERLPSECIPLFKDILSKDSISASDLHERISEIINYEKN